MRQAEADGQYLSRQLQRLRLILKRRALWLRSQWADDSLSQQCYQGLVISDARADWLLAGEDRYGQEYFYTHDPAASQIGGALKEIESELEGIIASSDVLPSLETLVRRFGLTPFERDVVLLCLAFELDPSFERVFAYVQDDITRRYVTANLALTLFGSAGTAREARLSLSADGPLRKFGLVDMQQGPMPATPRDARPLKIDEGVVDYILGRRGLDEKAGELLREVTSLSLPDPYPALIDRLERFLRPDLEQGKNISLNLIGPSGSGKMAVACSICERLGMRLFSLDHRSIPQSVPAGEPNHKETVRLLEREALLFNAAYYIDGSDDGKESVEHIGRIIDHLDAPLIIGSVSRWRASHFGEMTPVDMPEMDARIRYKIWQQVMPGFDGELESAAQQFVFGPRAIVEAAASTSVRSRLRGSQCPGEGDLWQACREQSAFEAEGLAQPIAPKASFEDIVLPRDTLSQLEEIAAQVANRPKVYDEWGFGRKLSRGRGISALFSGPSGAGKTMAAEILANHLKLDMYRIDLAGVVSKYIGETEKNLKKVFDAAEMSGAILFFDEADALFGKRTEVKDSHDRYANIEVNYLLQRMEDYRGLAVLATNRKSFLDQAFLRRIRFTVDFPFPDALSRKLIWQKMLPGEPFQEKIDYDALCRLEITGGNIRNVAVNAAFLAAEERRPIGMDHIMRSAKREYAKIERLLNESEFGEYYRLVKS